MTNKSTSLSGRRTTAQRYLNCQTLTQTRGVEPTIRRHLSRVNPLLTVAADGIGGFVEASGIAHDLLPTVVVPGYNFLFDFRHL